METKTRKEIVAELKKSINYETDMDQLFRIHLNNGKHKLGYVLDFDDDFKPQPDKEPRFIWRSADTGKVSEEYFADLRAVSIPKYAI